MPLQIIRDDIAQLHCDAVVNPTNASFNAEGGVDKAIHAAAGKELIKACQALGNCKVGESVITDGFHLPAKYVIHTAVPHYTDGNKGEAILLRACYESALNLAIENHCDSVAFPVIAAGFCDYPKEEALRIATDVITSFLKNHDLNVFLAVFDQSSFLIGEKLFSEIKCYIDDCYAQSRLKLCRRNKIQQSWQTDADYSYSFEESDQSSLKSFQTCDSGLEDALKSLDESFTQMLLRKIDEKGISDVECYKKANIDRKLFSKIRNNPQYKPKKTTAIAFAIALELSFEETEEMLMKAGYALSHSNKFDIIIEYFISKGNYDIFEINEALFSFDQVLLGC